MIDVILTAGTGRRLPALLGACALAGCSAGDETRGLGGASEGASPSSSLAVVAAPGGVAPASVPREAPSEAVLTTAKSPPVRVPAPREVPRIRTWLTPEGLLTALARGHVRAFGEEARWPRLAGGYALCAFENASGAALYNFNFGNLVARNVETVHARWPVAETGGDRMQAHASVDEGAAAFWRTMRDVHGSALRAFDAGKYRDAVTALAKFGYFRADPARYEAALPSLASYASSRLIPTVRKEAAARGVPVSALSIDVRTTFVDDLLVDRELP